MMMMYVCMYVCDCMCCIVPPRITRGPVSGSEVEGSSATLQCRVVAAPYPDTIISWTKDGHLLDVSRPLLMHASSNAVLLKTF